MKPKHVIGFFDILADLLISQPIRLVSAHFPWGLHQREWFLQGPHLERLDCFGYLSVKEN